MLKLTYYYYEEIRLLQPELVHGETYSKAERGKSPGAAKPQMKELPWGSSKIWALSGMSHLLNE